MLKKLRYIDYWVLIPYLVLCVFGIIMVYSASADYYIIANGKSAFSFLMRQIAYVLMGVLITFVTFQLKLEVFRGKRFIQYFTAVMFLAYFYLMFFGRNTNGATGWIFIGPISIQPSEVLKLFFILYLSNILTKHRDRLEIDNDIMSFYRSPIVMVLVFVVLTYLQHDLGGSAINSAIALVIFFAAGVDYRKGIGIIFAGIATGVFFLMAVASRININTSNYMLQRIVGFAHPFELAKGAGNQLVNSYYALGNGGIFGVGLGNSIQKKGYLPEANTDFIMSVVAEELGLITVVLIIGLLSLIIFRAIILGIRANSMYQTMICYGIATYFTVQTFFNVGGVIGMLPITGVTFPFISYGGSSMVVLTVCIGLLLNISATQEREIQLRK